MKFGGVWRSLNLAMAEFVAEFIKTDSQCSIRPSARAGEVLKMPVGGQPERSGLISGWCHDGRGDGATSSFQV